MNVREMIEEIPRRYPKVGIKRSTEYTVDSDWFRLYFEGGWMINIGYSRRDYSSNRVEQLSNSMDATHFEISIFKPDGSYFISEDMVTWTEVDGELPTSGFYGWAESTKLFMIMDYISQMDSASLNDRYNGA